MTITLSPLLYIPIHAGHHPYYSARQTADLSYSFILKLNTRLNIIFHAQYVSSTESEM